MTAADRLRETLREDGWAEGSLAMGQLDDALAEAAPVTPPTTDTEPAERLRAFVAAWRSFNNPSDEVYRLYRDGKEYALFIDDIAALAAERASGGLDAQTTDLLAALAERNIYSRGDLEVLLDG